MIDWDNIGDDLVDDWSPGKCLWLIAKASIIAGSLYWFVTEGVYL